MLVDLHAHYPMHLIPRKGGTHAALREWPSERLRAQIINLLSLRLNYQGPGDTPGVTVDLLRDGEVGVVLSVLLEPFDEVDLKYGSPPHPAYFGRLMEQLKLVEDEVATHAPAARVVHTGRELEECVKDGQLAFVHAVEGGFHLGADEAGIAANVAELNSHGVAYVTLAHILWRRVATNTPAIPSLPDWLYRLIFPQPGEEGLSHLGRAAVRAMAAHRMLVDVTHMSDASLTDTFDLLDELDEGRELPVIATHMACRFGDLAYSLQDETIARIARRGGVLGVIDCQHYIANRRRRNAADETFEDSVDLICEHIDHIAGVTGGYDQIAIGSDLDGYIKPALVGLEHCGHMRDLQRELTRRYGQQRAQKICSENALRVLHARFA
jgi:microsomal dipeptidase-like Zn-dependent dipeptidase